MVFRNGDITSHREGVRGEERGECERIKTNTVNGGETTSERLERGNELVLRITAELPEMGSPYLDPSQLSLDLHRWVHQGNICQKN